MAESTIGEAIKSHLIYITKTWYKQSRHKLKIILKVPKNTEKSNNVHIYKVPYMNDLGIVPLQVQPIARLPEGDSIIIHQLIGPFF